MSERFHPTMTETYAEEREEHAGHLEGLIAQDDDTDTGAPPCERCSAPAERITCYDELLCDRCYWRWEHAVSHPCPCCYAGFIERYDEGKIPCDVCFGTGIDPLEVSR